jgi:aminocarboxymuconate-semialdehyde decarboxylase
VASATAGIVIGGREFANAALGASQAAPARRRVMIGGRRVTVIDIHAHTFVPEVWDLVKDTPALAAVAKINLTGAIALGPGTPARLQYMDKEGIDYQAINVNAWGYSADRALATDLIQLQNERIAAAVAAHPDRFVGMATLSLQHPDLAAEQLDVAVKKLGLRGAAIGGSVEGE